MLYHKKKTPVNTEVFNHTRDPGGILTPDRWSRNPVLYTAELRSLFALVTMPVRRNAVQVKATEPFANYAKIQFVNKSSTESRKKQIESHFS